MSSLGPNTLHYGGSLRPAGSGTPGLSPQPFRRGRGRPTRNGSFASQKRFEMITRLENAFIPESAIAGLLSISVPRLRYLKKTPEYLIVRMRLTHGIILDEDAKIADIKEQRKELLLPLLPPALQALANTLMKQPGSFAETKLQTEVARDVLDRSDIYAKVSRTELKPVTFFDFEKSDADSNKVLAALKGAAALPSPRDNMIQAIIDTSKEFSEGSRTLTESEAQEALSELENKSS